MTQDSGLYFLVRKLLNAKTATEAREYIDQYVGDEYLSIARELVARVIYKRTTDQNSLYWRWVSEVGQYTGQTKQEVHREAKLALGCPILFRDNQGFAEF